MLSHRVHLDMPDRQSGAHVRRRGARGFTLVEWMVAIAIVSILLSIGAFAFNNVEDNTTLAQAKNAVLAYAAVARGYAIANQIETMFVVNPYNGRFEVWYLNPPRHGGKWDPLSGGDPSSSPELCDGYAFAPHVFDKAAALPRNGNGRPMVAIHPIDYAEPLGAPAGVEYRPTDDDADERNIDNLTWAALCFDENGKLVIRTRRIATRSYHFRDGAERQEADRNRMEDESPAIHLIDQGFSLVNSFDTAITTTQGFVFSELSKMELAIGDNPTPAALVDDWLELTRPGQKYASFAETVILDRFSGRAIAGDD